MKCHVGNGFVYLRPSLLDDSRGGWMNLECRESEAVLAPDAPDLVKRFGTTDDDYYSKFSGVTEDTLRKGPIQADVPPVCDAYGTAQSIPASDGGVTEILGRQVFEHFSIREARAALTEFHRVLACGGILRLDVPCHDGTVAKIREGDDPFWARHLLGCKKNDVAYHVMSYTREALRRLVEEYGFVYDGEEKNVHFIRRSACGS